MAVWNLSWLIKLGIVQVKWKKVIQYNLTFNVAFKSALFPVIRLLENMKIFCVYISRYLSIWDFNEVLTVLFLGTFSRYPLPMNDVCSIMASRHLEKKNISSCITYVMQAELLLWWNAPEAAHKTTNSWRQSTNIRTQYRNSSLIIKRHFKALYRFKKNHYRILLYQSGKDDRCWDYRYYVQFHIPHSLL